VEERIQSHKRKIAEIRTGESLEGKPDEEVARILSDSGL